MQLFILLVKNQLKGSIKIDNYKRYDHITKSLILLIERVNLNIDYKWISYETFYKYLKITIKDNNTINNIDNYIKIIELESDFGLLNNQNNNQVIKLTQNNIIDNSKIDNILTDIGLVNLALTCDLNALLKVLYH